MSERLGLGRCQNRLLILWYVGALPSLIILIGQILSGAFAVRLSDGGLESKAQEAVAMWLSAMMPSLSLVTGVAAANALTKEKESARPTVIASFFWFTFAFSAFYLALIGAVFLYIPYSSLSPLGHLSQANLFLAPLQGLVSAALGGLFVSSKK